MGPLNLLWDYTKFQRANFQTHIVQLICIAIQLGRKCLSLKTGDTQRNSRQDADTGMTKITERNGSAQCCVCVCEKQIAESRPTCSKIGFPTDSLVFFLNPLWPHCFINDVDSWLLGLTLKAANLKWDLVLLHRPQWWVRPILGPQVSEPYKEMGNQGMETAPLSDSPSCSSSP